MKKVMLIGLLAVSSVASVTFAMQSGQSSVRRGPQPCKKVLLTCPSGAVYYKCIHGSTNSTDCYPVGEGCNITEYPCNGGPVGL